MTIARDWLGTPFVDGASVCGIGADCAGLIEGIARQLGCNVPARLGGALGLPQAANQFLIPLVRPQAGAIILLAQKPTGPAVHAGIVTDTDTIIHAHWRAGVVENRYGSWFIARTTHIFAWPDLVMGEGNN